MIVNLSLKVSGCYRVLPINDKLMKQIRELHPKDFHSYVRRQIIGSKSCRLIFFFELNIEKTPGKSFRRLYIVEWLRGKRFRHRIFHF